MKYIGLTLIMTVISTIFFTNPKDEYNDASHCIFNCYECINRCINNKSGKELDSCKELCFEINNSCCVGHNRKPFYKSCGCSTTTFQYSKQFRIKP